MPVQVDPMKPRELFNFLEGVCDDLGIPHRFGHVRGGEVRRALLEGRDSSVVFPSLGPEGQPVTYYLPRWWLHPIKRLCIWQLRCGYQGRRW